VTPQKTTITDYCCVLPRQFRERLPYDRRVTCHLSILTDFKKKKKKKKEEVSNSFEFYFFFYENFALHPLNLMGFFFFFLLESAHLLGGSITLIQFWLGSDHWVLKFTPKKNLYAYLQTLNRSLPSHRRMFPLPWEIFL